MLVIIICLSHRNNTTFSYLAEIFEDPIINIFVIGTMWDGVNHIKHHTKVTNFITSIAGNNVDMFPPLISMEMFNDKVSKRIIYSTISL